MKIQISNFVRFLIILCSLFPMIAFAGFDEGIAAYQNQNYATARRELEPLARKGDATSEAVLGTMYYLGQGVQKDLEEAIRWLRPSAEQGNVVAQGLLALMYHGGQGVPQDFIEAMKWCRLAAEQGNDSAQTFLGAMYQDGLGGVHASNVVANALYILSAADQSNQIEILNAVQVARSKLSANGTDASKALALELAKPGNLLKALDNYMKKPTIKEKW
jgi:TPR repeat protein